MVILNPTTNKISVGETRLVEIDYTDDLGSSETLSSVTSVAEQGSSDLTISGSQVNTGTPEIMGRTVAANKSMQFSVSGGKANKTYTIRVTMATSASQTLVEDFKLIFV